MKKIVLFSLLLVSTLSFAQSKNALKDVSEVVFYGVDFSIVGIVGAEEEGYKFIESFGKINELMQREYSKYVKPLGKKTNVNIISVDLEPVAEKNAAMTNKSLNRASEVAPVEEPAIKKVLDGLNIKRTEGYGVILIAEELNKPQNRGIYELVFFNIANKEIITHAKISGKAKGFGLRNFWANSIYNSINKIKLSK